MLGRFFLVVGLLVILSVAAERLMGSAKSSGRMGHEMAVAVKEVAAGREIPDVEPVPPTHLADAPARADRGELQDAVERLQSWQGSTPVGGGHLDSRDAARQLLAAAEAMESEAKEEHTPHWIEGRVVDAEDGHELAGVRIERAGKLLGVTDEEGRFAIESAPQSILPVVLIAPRHARVYCFLPATGNQGSVHDPDVQDSLAKMNTPAPQLTFELVRGAILEGVLVDSDDSPLPGVRLIVRATAEDLHYQQASRGAQPKNSTNFHAPDPSWEGWADDEGRLRIDNLPPGVPLALSFWEPEAEPRRSNSPLPRGVEDGALPLGCLLAPDRPVVLRPEELRRVQWRLRPERDELPVAGAEDVDGSSLRMADLVAKPSTQKLTRPGFRPPTSSATPTLPVNFTNNGNLVPGAVAVPKVRPSLAGRVVDERGEPLDGMMVVGRREGEPGLSSSVCDSQGRFHLLDLQEGDWNLQVLGKSHHPHNRFGPFEVTAFDRTEAAEAYGVELELVLRQGVSLVGRVVGQDGEEAAARVEILACGGRASRVQSLESTATGEFSTDKLEARSYDLVASDRNGGIATIFDLELQPASIVEAPDLKLGPGGTLKLRVKEGPLVQRAVLLYEGHAIRSADMRKHVPLELLMPAGPVEIQLYHGARRISQRSVTVKAGETLPIDL